MKFNAAFLKTLREGGDDTNKVKFEFCFKMSNY